MSSMEVNVDVLEQMDLMDLSDQEALDVFLNSGGEDNTVISPGLGKSNDHTRVTSRAQPLHECLFPYVVRHMNVGCPNLCTQSHYLQ